MKWQTDELHELTSHEWEDRLFLNAGSDSLWEQMSRIYLQLTAIFSVFLTAVSRKQ